MKTSPQHSLRLILIFATIFLAACSGSSSTAQEVAVSTDDANSAAAQQEDSVDQATTPTDLDDADATPEVVEPEPTPSPAPAANDDEAQAPEPDPTAVPTEDPVEIPEYVPPTGVEPVRIMIPAIGVDAPTIDLSLGGIEPEVPTDFDDTGWYTQTRQPGEIGPAVIAGHIDSRTGPAVFAELDQLVPGDEIIVQGAEGEQRTFVVADAQQYPKGDLPEGVFGFGDPVPELRLITCGGTFDPDSGHYRDNYIVFAHLAEEA